MTKGAAHKQRLSETFIINQGANKALARLTQRLVFYIMITLFSLTI